MKGLKFFVDTNIFLRALIKDHPKQAKESLAFLNKVKSGKYDVHTSSLVLSELVWTCQRYYHLDKKTIIDLSQALLGIPHLKIIDTQNVSLGIELFEKYPVKFIDALIASSPEVQEGEGVIVSYDKDFDRLGVKRVTPDYFLN